jgi:hypothetical protein
MDWHAQYRRGRAYQVDWFDTREVAIEAACRFLDGGHEVFAIRTETLSDTIGKDDVARIHALLTTAAGRRSPQDRWPVHRRLR